MFMCPNCGTTVGQDDKFCHNCGNDFEKHPPKPAEKSTSNETISGRKTIDPNPHPFRPNSDEVQPELPAGTVFADRFEIVRMLGRGGMGAVYEARDRNLNDTVALKIIRPGRSTNEAALKRLVEEGRTSRKLTHSNIIRVHDVSLHEGQPFIVMEKLEGQSLRSWMNDQFRRRQPIPYPVVANIVSEILLGLAEAHKESVIHRDLKPENVFVLGTPSEAGARVKILDFGIANLEGDGSGMPTGSSSTAGTIGYMAPEQENRADTAGPPADLYAITVMFYELLMENRPSVNRTPPSSARQDVPSAIDALINAGLADYPRSRPQTAEAYFEQIQKASAGSDWLNNIRKKFDERHIKQSHFWAPIYRKMGMEWKEGEKVRYTPRNIVVLSAWVVGFWLIAGGIAYGMNGGLSTDADWAGDSRSAPAYVEDDDYGDDTGVYTPTPAPTPQPRTQGFNYANLSGTWYEDGVGLQASVDRNGNFELSGVNPYNGMPVRVQGSSNGRNAQLHVTIPGAQLRGVGTFDSDYSHLNFSIQMPDNSRYTGVYHINHVE